MGLSDYIEEKPVLNSKRLIKEWLSESSLYEYWGKKASKVEKNPELLFEKRKREQKIFIEILYIRSVKCGYI